MKLRKARLSDAKVFYEIRNDPESRRYSHSSGEISWGDHVKWFRGNYRNGFFVIEDRGLPVGYLRIKEVSLLSIGLIRESRGKGFASRALELVGQLPSVVTVHKNNRASLRLFKRAGFKCVQEPYLTMMKN